MLRAAWRTFIRPPLIPPIAVLGTAALISLAAAQLAAAAPLHRASAAADCSTAGAAARAMARHAGRGAAVSERLDAGGVFAGRTLRLPGRGSIDLPPDSSVALAVGDALAYTSTNGGRSDIHLADVATGCDSVVARMAGIARSAILSPDGAAVYVHSVTFPARNDAGVTRFGLDDSAPSQVVPPLPDDDRFGLTFATQLGWSTDSTTLFVQSCAVDACRTRLLDLATGSVVTFAAPDQGPVIAVTPQHLVTYAACGGLPCAVLSIDRASGARSTLTEQAWSAALTGGARNPIVQIETATGTLEVAQ